jgi:hypothetical protein
MAPRLGSVITRLPRPDETDPAISLALADRLFAAIAANDTDALRNEVYAPDVVVWHNNDNHEQRIFAALKAHLSDEQILELTYITALYVMHAIMSRALRTEYDNNDEPVVEIAAPESYTARDIAIDIAGPAPAN